MERLGENILSWCTKPEESAVLQAVHISELPCICGNVCLMPDTHEGYGMPIGCVAALYNAVSPNMVGKDIGCGMRAIKLDLTEIPDKDKLKEIVDCVYSKVPVGMRWHDREQSMPVDLQNWFRDLKVCSWELAGINRQLGTLGGGNHFIEIQYGDDGHVWIMVHCGSRNLGAQVAHYYDTQAMERCLRWYHKRAVDNDIAFIPKGDRLYDAYLEEAHACMEFAKLNRERIAQRVLEAFFDCKLLVEALAEYDIPHNYVSMEHHYGKNVMVHRKGATLAREGRIGIIPGSQGAASYIVLGLGKEASMCSCSHGAGRRMSRKKARETLSLEDTVGKQEAMGIVHGIKDVTDLDEAPEAYKDIDTVMEEQKDLVEPLVKLRPLAVIKG